MLGQNLKIIDSPIKVCDILLVPKNEKHYGEYWDMPSTTMQLDRLYNYIMDLIQADVALHKKSYCEQNGNVKNEYKNTITRFTTSEFSFYTQSPLSLSDFTRLQNRLYWFAKSAPKNMVLILSSFAVKLNATQFMNVVVHIECNQEPTFSFIVKEFESENDPEYDNFQYVSNHNFTPVSIAINGKKRMVSFDNIIECTTSGGARYLTAIEICLVHKYATAETALEKIVNAYIKHKKIVPLQLSHIITSNTIQYHPENALKKNVTHVDPKYLSKKGQVLASEKIKFCGKKGFKAKAPGVYMGILPLKQMQSINEHRFAHFVTNALVEIGTIPNHFLRLENAYQFIYNIIDSVQSLYSIDKILLEIDQKTGEDGPLAYLRKTVLGTTGVSSYWENIVYLIDEKINTLEEGAFHFILNKYKLEIEKNAVLDIHSAIANHDDAMFEKCCKSYSSLNVRDQEKKRLYKK